MGKERVGKPVQVDFPIAAVGDSLHHEGQFPVFQLLAMLSHLDFKQRLTTLGGQLLLSDQFPSKHGPKSTQSALLQGRQFPQ